MNNILDIFQSGFQTKHGTESALLKVTNDILLSIDSGKRVALMMLDLTAAFDTLDHAILIERLRDYVGIKGVALKWFSSYLQDRTCLVPCFIIFNSLFLLLWIIISLSFM